EEPTAPPGAPDEGERGERRGEKQEHESGAGAGHPEEPGRECDEIHPEQGEEPPKSEDEECHHREGAEPEGREGGDAVGGGVHPLERNRPPRGRPIATPPPERGALRGGPP